MRDSVLGSILVVNLFRVLTSEYYSYARYHETCNRFGARTVGPILIESRPRFRTLIGVKLLIDLPRTDSGSLEGLLHQLENFKNGISLSVLFGSGVSTILDPPWIVVAGNSRLPMAGWTPDR